MSNFDKLPRKRAVTFLNELKERKVLRVAVAYFIVTWIVIQVADSTFEALSVPEWAGTLLVVFVMLGFPFALLLAWAYELTPDGIVKDPDGNAGQHTSFGRSWGDAAKIHEENLPPSIAVMQFEDMSPERDQNYFCEGIAEEILSALNEVKGLSVAARLASFQFDSRCADIVEIGKKLNVSVILEGSVRKAGDHIRTTVQLINAKTGYQFWAGQYNHSLKDIFEVQEQIAQAVVSAMRLTIGDNRLTRSMTGNTDAYDSFLKAKSYFSRPDKQSIIFARHLLEKSVEIDPDFGRAWAKLASTYVFEYLCGDPSGNARSEARRISDIALRVSPDIAESHIASGITYAIHDNFAAADREFETAIDLYPDSFNTWFTWARSKTFEGDHVKAAEYYQKASELRPQDYQSVLMQMNCLAALGDTDNANKKAREGLQRAEVFLDLNPGEYRARNMGAFALHRLGRTDEAEVWMETSMQNSPRNSVLTCNAARFYALLGDIDKSLDYLSQAACTGCLNIDWLEQDEEFKAVKEDPRYSDIIERFKRGCSCGHANPAYF